MAKSLSLKVEEAIIKMIKDKELLPNEKLPNEYDLCDALKVSRPTLREAIKSLHSKNVLTVIRGKGTYVSEFPGVKDDPFGFTILSKKPVDELLSIKRIIDRELIVDIREQSTGSLDQLEEVLLKIKIYYESDKPFEVLTVDFMNALVVSSSNVVVKHMAYSVNKMLEENIVDMAMPIEAYFNIYRYVTGRSQNIEEACQLYIENIR